MKKCFTVKDCNVTSIVLKGFTLIELLVVVLIIGILAAIAVPQYQKVVEKSRAAEVVSNLRTLVNATQLYKLASGGQPPTSLEQLDVSITGTSLSPTEVESKLFRYKLSSPSGQPEMFEMIGYRKDGGSNAAKYYVYFSYIGTWACVALHKEAEPVCLSVCEGNKMDPHGGSATMCGIQRM